MSKVGSKVARTVFLSMAVIVLCALLLVTGSYALFTDQVSVYNHLQAGTLDATLERIGLVKTTLNTDGYLETITVQDEAVDEAVDFTGKTGKNVFELNGETVVPCTVLTAKMKLSNHSEVAFCYWLEVKTVDVKLEDGTTQLSDEELAKQLKLTVIVYNEDGTVNENESGSVQNGLAIGSAENGIGVLTVGKSVKFDVIVEFVNSNTAEADNDKAQDQQVAFDLVVNAVQQVSAATTA